MILYCQPILPIRQNCILIIWLSMLVKPVINLVSMNNSTGENKKAYAYFSLSKYVKVFTVHKELQKCSSHINTNSARALTAYCKSIQLIH